MQLRREFLLGVGCLVGFNVLLALGAVGLFTRMGPAIENILEENVFSNEAAEDMLVVLAKASRGVREPVDQEQFEQALLRARENVTEAEEIPVLAQIDARKEAAFSGDEEAIAAIGAAVSELVGINRQAMTKADERAQRLGAAGAWAAVVIALVSFGLSVVVALRLEKRVVDPLIELQSVLEAVHSGNTFRRCRTAQGCLRSRTWYAAPPMSCRRAAASSRPKSSTSSIDTRAAHSSPLRPW